MQLLRRGARTWSKGDQPAHHNAKIWQHDNTKAERLVGDQNLRHIRHVAWEAQTGQHRRSQADTKMFQLKAAYGEDIPARSFEGQAAPVVSALCRL